MASDYCKYHPLTPANWHCPACHVSDCDDCTQLSGEMETVPQCLVCNQPLTPITTTAETQPFWQHYTAFMRLPFNPYGVAGLALMVLLPALAPESLLLPLAALGYLLLALYGWALLQHTATGSLKLPQLPAILRTLNRQAVEVALVAAVVLTGLGQLAARSPGLTILLGVVLIVAAPAALMALAIDRSLSVLGRPRSWLEAVAGLRFAYLPLTGAGLVLFAVAYAVCSLLADVLPPGLIQGVRQGSYGYSLWVVMALTGYALFQYRQVLGFEVAGQKVRKRVVTRKMDHQAARLEVFLKEGLYDRAAALLKAVAEKQKKNPEIQERYYQLLVFMQDREQIPFQAANYLEALLDTQQLDLALQVLEKLQFLIPDFRPQSPDLCFELAQACVRQQDHVRAVRLLRNLHQESPHYANLPEAYLLLAKLLHDKQGETHEALEVMEYLVARFKKHPRYAQIESYWRQLGGKPKEDFLI